uniref:NADH dehydrogenase subunit 2 n=1 Tax=Arrugada affinis TaxID=706857 RepID=UPI002E77486D|nr:NADH dehydrogenase subunit 2 [Arrugada affinis]WRK21414.1 NADH dehydrogenase subunit 2 [Arrugada affinis]
MGKINSTKVLMTNTMMIGVIMVICSNNWVTMWMGLEISMVSFIPFMQSSNLSGSESMIKYFITQCVASTMFLVSVVIMLIGVNMMNEMMLTTAMLISIGSAPFHNWVLMIIETMEIYPMLTMLTVLKMPPLTIMYHNDSKIMSVPIFLSFVASAILCLNQSSMRKTIGYSSIFNVGLMLSTMKSFNTLMMFMVIYASTMISLIVSVKMMRINYINQMAINEFNPWIKMNLWINMLSMAGFPPLLGFMGKMIILQSMLVNNQIMLSITMMTTSLMVMMFYTRLTFSSMLMNSSSKKWMINSNKMVMFMMTFNLTSTFLMTTASSIY